MSNLTLLGCDCKEKNPRISALDIPSSAEAQLGGEGMGGYCLNGDGSPLAVLMPLPENFGGIVKGGEAPLNSCPVCGGYHSEDAECFNYDLSLLDIFPNIEAFENEKQEISGYVQTNCDGKVIRLNKRKEISGKTEREKISGCRKTYEKHTHPVHAGGCGAIVVIPHKCNSKWCRTCFNAWAFRLRPSLYDALSQMQWLSHIVLTIKDVPRGGLSEVLKFLKKSFSRLQHQKIWKDNVKSGVVSIGLKWNGDWHPHLHIACDCRWIVVDELSKAWEKASKGHGKVVHVTRAYNVHGLVKEIIKGSKDDMKNLTEYFKTGIGLFDEAVKSFHGIKRVWAFGGIRVLKKEKVNAYCPRCGEKYRWREWSHEVLTVEELQKAKMGNPFLLLWVDCYRGFIFNPSECEFARLRNTG